jgi:hypothetical protein
MGWESVFYKGKSFDLNNQIISWLQKFMELYLLNFNHPNWFKEVLEDLHGNFHVPHGKYFFDEDIIGDDKERLDYCLKMLDQTIEKMESITMEDFLHKIYDSIKGSWCEISNESFQGDWIRDDKIYKEKYIGSLKKLREIMREN